MRKKKILVVFGTRPEAIKFAPVIKELSKFFDLKICSTGQHKELLDQVTELFEIEVDYELNIMQSSQGLNEITSKIIIKLDKVLEESEPDLVIVHGDTTTCMAAALAAFYKKIRVAHLEAGLRTNDIYSPFPEELNRQITSLIADIHFAPTKMASDKLLEENIDSNKIKVVGNSVIDALLGILPFARKQNFPKKFLNQAPFLNDYNPDQNPLIVVTGHRRENFGEGINQICLAIKEIAHIMPSVYIIFSVHLNPNIKEPVEKILKNVKNVFLVEPLDYLYFVKLLDLSYLILTDSGGIQEEAPTLGKPVIIMREKTERREGIESGTVFLQGSSQGSIVSKALELLRDRKLYKEVSAISNPYGDGKTSSRVAKHLLEVL